MKHEDEPMKSLFASSILIGSMLQCLALPPSYPHEVEAAELLRAEVIAIGRVNTINTTGQTVTEYRGVTMAATVSESSIDIDQVLKGKGASRAKIVDLLRPSLPHQYLGIQELVAARTYLFFLNRAANNTDLEPAAMSEFALELEAVPLAPPASLEGAVRAIAKRNVDATNPFLAERWARFLGGMYDRDSDLPFWLDNARSPRLGIRAIALCVLAKHEPKLPSLYSEVLAFVTDTSTGHNLALARHSLIQQLSALLTEHETLSDEIRRWLTIDSRQINEMVLRLIAEKRDTAFVGDVVNLMTRTDDRLTQYECIKTLSALKGVKFTSYPKFLKSPDEYIEAWRKATNGPVVVPRKGL